MKSILREKSYAFALRIVKQIVNSEQRTVGWWEKEQVMKSILKEKSYAFALRVVKLYKYLCADKKEYVMSKQVLRSGTAIS